jgi:nitrate reductase delta subunit
MTGERRLFHLYALILEYPRSDLSETVRECQSLVALGNPEAAALIGGFRTYLDRTSLERLQEIYTVTFDLDATYHPYVGHHLFGESYKRSAFLVGLKERYQTFDYTFSESELADHLAVILGFLAICDDAVLTNELIQDALLPSLERMVKEDQDAAKSPHGDEQGSDRSPYQQVLQALRMVLEQHLVNDGQPKNVQEAIVTGGPSPER